MKNGFTLIEIMVGTAVLLILLLGLYDFFSNIIRSSEVQAEYMTAQITIQKRLDDICQEIRESSIQNVWHKSYNDLSFEENPQSILILFHARDRKGNFKSKGLKPQWQSVIVYAPYWNREMGWGELRRYFISPVPASFKAEGFSPDIEVKDEFIDIHGIMIKRDGGRVFLVKLNSFVARGEQKELAILISRKVETSKYPVTVYYTTGVKGRN
jgi:prepilin-type N-terminal cleavage/methylation domain-containing protein